MDRLLKQAICVGLDVHRDFTRATARDASGKILCRQRLDHADRQRLRKELSKWPAGMPVILEASFGWSWMADELERAGHRPYLACCRKVAGWRKSRSLAKTNRLDADLTSELWFQKPPWWQVWLVPQEVRERREILRLRMRLSRLQTSLRNSVHATLHRQGIVHGHADLFGAKGRALLEELCGAEDQRLSPMGKLALRHTLKVLQTLRSELAELVRTVRQQVQENLEAQLWKTLPGIGLTLAHTIMAEAGPMERFKKPKHLVRYSLLCPVAQDSGEENNHLPLGRHLSKAGRRTLKWAFIEAAHAAVRKDPSLKGLWLYHSDGGKRNKGRAYVVVARNLCRMGHACVREHRSYSPVPPSRPTASRPDRAGPLAAMAVERASSKGPL